MFLYKTVFLSFILFAIANIIHWQQADNKFWQRWDNQFHRKHQPSLNSNLVVLCQTKVVYMSSRFWLLDHKIYLNWKKKSWTILSENIYHFINLAEQTIIFFSAWDVSYTVVLSCSSERKKVHGIWPSPSLNTMFSEHEIKKIEIF